MSIIEREATGTLDWIVFTIALICCVLLFISFSLLIFYKRYAPLKAKNVANLSAIILSGILHIIGTLIANEHLEAVRIVNYQSCILGSVFIQYALGLGVWFAAVIYRCMTFGMVFNTRIDYKNMDSKLLYVDAAVAFLYFPIMIICLMSWLLGGIVFDDTLDTCTTTDTWKICIMLWIVVNMFILIALIPMILNGIKNKFFNEKRSLIIIIGSGFVALCFCGYFVFTDSLNYRVPRCIFLFTVVLLHVIVFFQLIVPSLYRASVYDINHLQKFGKSINPEYDIRKLTELKDIKLNEMLWADFLAQCVLKQELPRTTLLDHGIIGKFVPKRAVDFLFHTQYYRISFQMKLSTIDETHEKIMDNFIRSNNTGICLPDSIKLPLHNARMFFFLLFFI